MQLTVLGGAGEHGRSSYLLTEEGQHVVLDYGVKKEDGGQYPIVDDMDALISGLQTVFLSHAHEDHCIALPILYRHGYRGQVWTTRATVQQLPAYFNAWRQYTDQREIERPYDHEDEQRIQYSYIEDRVAPGQWGELMPGMEICWGRSGHLPGSIWLTLSWKGKCVFFSGDYTSESQILRTDRPLHHQHSLHLYNNNEVRQNVQASLPILRTVHSEIAQEVMTESNHYGYSHMGYDSEGLTIQHSLVQENIHLGKKRPIVPIPVADHSTEFLMSRTHSPYLLPDLDLAIVDAAYGDEPDQQTDKLYLLKAHIDHTLQQGGSVLLPVPLYGRGQELLLWASQQYPDVPIVVEAALREGLQLLANYTEWLHEEVDVQMKQLGELTNVITLSGDNEIERLHIQHQRKIIFTPDGMLQTSRARQHYERIKKDQQSIVIFTGHLAKGSLGSKLVQEPPLDGCQIVNICYKVHQGLPDVQQMLDNLNRPPAVLVHAPQQRTDQLASYLCQQGYNRIYSLVPTDQLEF